MESGSQPSATRNNPPKTQAVLGLFTAFAALSTIFVLIITVPEAIQEYAQRSWPDATATINRCSVEPSRTLGTRRERSILVWRIGCTIHYRAGEQEIQTSLGSRSTNSDADRQLMVQWVGNHRAGSSMVVHYDPNGPQNAVLTATDMPYGGPRTPDNLKLLSIAATLYAVLLVAARIMRTRQRASTHSFT
jgi:hypothetical protein